MAMANTSIAPEMKERKNAGSEHSQDGQANSKRQSRRSGEIGVSITTVWRTRSIHHVAVEWQAKPRDDGKGAPEVKEKRKATPEHSQGELEASITSRLSEAQG